MSPGTALRHYAPDAPTYLVAPLEQPETWLSDLAAGAVVLDIGGRLAWLKPHAHAYRDLAARTGRVREAARGLFEALRWAEVEANKVAGGKVLLCDLRAGPSFAEDEEEFAAAVADRMVRAASGKVIGHSSEGSEGAAT